MRALVVALLVVSANAGASPRADFAPLAADGWRATWNGELPTALWGGHVDAPGALADAALAERAARAFLAAHRALVPADLEVVSNRVDGDVRTVGFRQVVDGLPVIDAQVGVVFAHDRLFAVISHVVAGVTVAPVSAARAPAARAEAWLARIAGEPVQTIATKQRAILAQAGRFAIVDVLDVAAGARHWDVYVTPDGTPLGHRATTSDATATLTFNAGVRYPLGLRADMPAPHLAIAVNGSPTTTGADGTFSWTGTAPATVVPTLAGTYIKVINAQGPSASTSLTAQPAGHVAWDLSTDEVGDAQLSTYLYASAAKVRARVVNPAVATWLDGQLPFYVNETGTTCNAYANPDDVHFVRKDATCENTGRLADVVYHEFGHAFHAHSVIPGMGMYESQLSEGLADYNAANMTEDPGIGRGFYFDDNALRDIDPDGREAHWPEDIDVDPHITGEILSGALWDLRKTLIRELGHDPGVAQVEKIFTGIMQRAASIPDAYVAALIADDNDGDLGNGTPHGCEIERAFGPHGLVPGFVDTSVGPVTVDAMSLAVPVSVPAASACPAPHVTSMTVTWKVGDDVASSFDLVPDPDGATWRGSFPSEPDGTVILYTVDVLLEDGTRRVFPDNPADPLYQLFVGTPHPIQCWNMDTDPMWSQSGNMGFEFEWGVPGAAPTSGDPPAAYTGTHVLGTDVTGDGLYRPEIIAAIQTPPVDVGAYQVVRLQYRRWLGVEDGRYDVAAIRVNDQEAWKNAATPAGTLDHRDREWRFHDVELTPYVTDGMVTVQWSLATDLTKQLGGWSIDDVCIVGMAKIPLCGDGVLDAFEQCDDGNTTSGDGCSSTCRDEVEAGGGGGCCSTTGGGPGSLLLAALVLLTSRRRRDASRGPRRCDRSPRGCRSRRAGRADRP